MSMRVVQFELTGEDPPRMVNLKRWSTAKLFALLETVSQLIGKINLDMERLKNDQVGEIARVVASVSSAAQSHLTHIIRESLVESIPEETILEWSPEDYVGVLAKIFEQNLTETLLKNLGSLRAAVLPKKQ